MLKRNFIAKTALIMAFAMMLTEASVFAGKDEFTNAHRKIDLTDVTGEVVAPPLLTSAASSVAKEKEWYEYVFYSPQPVFHTYISDNVRMSFYDPYEYSSALVMEVDDTITDWSSNNSMEVSYTTGESIVQTNGESYETKTEVLKGYTDREETTTGPSTVTTTTENRTDSYNTSKSVTESDSGSSSFGWGLDAEINTLAASTLAGPFLGGAAPIVAALGLIIPQITVGINGSSEEGYENSSSYYEPIDPDDPDSKDDKGNVRTGYTVSTDSTTVDTSKQTTVVEKTIADRVTAVTGTTKNISTSISFNNSTTVSKTYDAAYFNDRGSPLQWKIIKYNVKMPMKVQVEYLVDGEWIHSESDYCMLNTIQGTCRAWLENGVAYYEHWGTGEPVTWDEFWGQFFTEESLIAAYQNKLYPDN